MMKGTHPCPQLSHLTPNEKARTTEKQMGKNFGPRLCGAGLVTKVKGTQTKQSC